MKHQIPFKRVFQQCVYREIPFSKHSWSLIESRYCVVIAKVFKRHLTGGLSRYKGGAKRTILPQNLPPSCSYEASSRCCRNAPVDSAWIAFSWSVPVSIKSFMLCWKSCLHFFSPPLPSHGGWSLRWVNSRIPLLTQTSHVYSLGWIFAASLPGLPHADALLREFTYPRDLGIKPFLTPSQVLKLAGNWPRRRHCCLWEEIYRGSQSLIHTIQVSPCLETAAVCSARRSSSHSIAH